jgi:hypothetical protein
MSFFSPLNNLLKGHHPEPANPEPARPFIRFAKEAIEDALLARVGLKWHRITPNNTALPQRAVEGGWTWANAVSHAKVAQFVGRIEVGEGHFVPGKVSSGEFHYNLDGKEYKAVSGYDVLVAMEERDAKVEFRWMPAAGQLKATESIVVGGRDPSGNYKLFIARRDHKNGVHVGYIAENSDNMTFSWGGGEVKSGFYDVLVVCFAEGAEVESLTAEEERMPSPSHADPLHLPEPIGPSPSELEEVVPIFEKHHISPVDSAVISPVGVDTLGADEGADIAGNLLRSIEDLENDLEDPDAPPRLPEKPVFEPMDVDSDALAHALDTPSFPVAPKPLPQHGSPNDIAALFPPTVQPAGKRMDPGQLYSDPKVADKVRQARERSAASAALGETSVFAQMGQAVSERGEKLSQLSLKTEAMENSAKGFLDLAKELNKHQQSKWF